MSTDTSMAVRQGSGGNQRAHQGVPDAHKAVGRLQRTRKGWQGARGPVIVRVATGPRRGKGEPVQTARRAMASGEAPQTGAAEEHSRCQTLPRNKYLSSPSLLSRCFPHWLNLTGAEGVGALVMQFTRAGSQGEGGEEQPESGYGFPVNRTPAQPPDCWVCRQ